MHSLLGRDRQITTIQVDECTKDMGGNSHTVCVIATVSWLISFRKVIRLYALYLTFVLFCGMISIKL